MHNCVTEDYSVEKKTRVKHDFQNSSLRFDMHKIVAGIEQKKIVGAGQLLVIGSLRIRVMKQCNTVLKHKQLFQIAIADYGVVSTCHVCAYSLLNSNKVMICSVEPGA